MPVEGLMIALIPERIGILPVLVSQSLKAPRSARTAKDGSFRATGEVPGRYVVRISPGFAGMKPPVTDFSRADEEAVDQGVWTATVESIQEKLTRCRQRSSRALRVRSPENDQQKLYSYLLDTTLILPCYKLLSKFGLPEQAGVIWRSGRPWSRQSGVGGGSLWDGN
jgi:hypothetical protein